MYLRPYQKLIAWKEAHELCLCIYEKTKIFPKNELYGLTSQMRRSAASVPTNIAEGNAKRTIRDKQHFLYIGEGSLEELHYQCFLSKDLSYISETDFADLHQKIQKVGYLIGQLKRSLDTLKAH